MRSPSTDSCTPGQADYGHWEHRTSSVSCRSNDKQPRCLDPDVPSEIDLDLGKRRLHCYLERRNGVQQGDTELSAAQPRVPASWRSIIYAVDQCKPMVEAWTPNRLCQDHVSIQGRCGWGAGLLSLMSHLLAQGLRQKYCPKSPLRWSRTLVLSL